MYQINYDKKAEKFLDKLPYSTRRRILRKISEAGLNPFHYFERLSERKDYKLRVGDYRVIADIDEGRQLIEVRLIAHRKNAYEKAKR